MKTIIDAIKAELALNAAQKDALNRALDILQDVTNETSKVKQPVNSPDIPVGWKVWDGDRDTGKLPENAYFWSRGLNKWEKSWLNGHSVKGMTMVYIVPDYHIYEKHNKSAMTPLLGHRFCLKGEPYSYVTHFWFGYSKSWEKKRLSLKTELHLGDTYLTDKPLPDPNN